MNFEEQLKQYEAEAAKRRDEALAEKVKLCTELEALGVATVEVTYSGYGDSGQMDGTTAKAKGDSEIALTPEMEERINDLCYALLEFEYAGWENNDGASGTFTLDVADKEIKLEHISYYTESSTTNHTF